MEESNSRNTTRRSRPTEQSNDKLHDYSAGNDNAMEDMDNDMNGDDVSVDVCSNIEDKKLVKHWKSQLQWMITSHLRKYKSKASLRALQEIKREPMLMTRRGLQSCNNSAGKCCERLGNALS